MDADGLTPQHIATLCGVSPDTVRHYEAVGVLPRARRADNGYRRFPPGTVARVQVIRRALAVGFSLPELAALFRERAGGAPPCRKARALAGRKLAEIDQRLADLTRLRKALGAIVRDWDARLAEVVPGAPAHLIDSLPELTRGALGPPRVGRKKKQ